MLRSDDSAGSLKQIFGDAHITKIMHGSDSDQRYLIGDLGIGTANIFDTARAFSFIQRIPTLSAILSQNTSASSFELISKHAEYSSLKKLCTVILDFEMDKYFCEADWKLRPLSEGMLDYARGDSHYLIAIYSLLIKLINPFVFPATQPESKDLPLK